MFRIIGKHLAQAAIIVISAMSGRKRLVMEIERARALIQTYIRMYIDVYGTPELPAYEH
jgi:hypothetical protein